MGLASIKKFFKNVAGTLTEEAALLTSAGAADADRLPALNANGVLDLTVTNGKASSAGAGDAGKLAALDAAGRLDVTMMPVGIAPDVAIITTTEALAAGDLVNVWSSAGAKARKADATAVGKEAHGFVLAAFGAGVPATVYFEGSNTALAGLTPGPQFLSTTAGASVAAAPSGSGNVVQRLGVALSATTLNFEPSLHYALA